MAVQSDDLSRPECFILCQNKMGFLTFLCSKTENCIIFGAYQFIDDYIAQ